MSADVYDSLTYWENRVRQLQEDYENCRNRSVRNVIGARLSEAKEHRDKAREKQEKNGAN